MTGKYKYGIILNTVPPPHMVTKSLLACVRVLGFYDVEGNTVCSILSANQNNPSIEGKTRMPTGQTTAIIKQCYV